MRRILTAIAALFVIIGGCRYAYGRERLRKADLGAWYEEDNARYFNGELQPIQIRWGDLRAENALGITRGDTEASEIELDRNELLTEADARAVLHHEECHAKTWGESPVHGPRFQDCMSRAGFIN
jgi:hypothetical protein